jgi:hypothetical protein
MKASELVKKLGSKLLGKKGNTPATGQYPGGVVAVVQTAAEAKVPEILLLDRLGVIQFHENWRN